MKVPIRRHVSQSRGYRWPLPPMVSTFASASIRSNSVIIFVHGERKRSRQFRRWVLVWLAVTVLMISAMAGRSLLPTGTESVSGLAQPPPPKVYIRF